MALTPFVVWCSETSENPDFARYRSIIDRMPFGEPPPNFDPTAAPGSAAAAAAAAAAAEAEGGMTEEQRTEEEQKLASSVRVSVLNVTPAGRTMVGFTDSSSKPPEHYYLPVGGERDGWRVKDADPATEKVTLSKSGIEVTLKLGEGSTGANGDKNKKNNITRGRPPFRHGGIIGARLGRGPNGLMQAAETGETPAGTVPQGAMARLREQRARQMREEQEAAKRQADAAAEAKAESDRRAAEVKEAAEQAAAEREAQRETLMQIQEELRRQREEKEKQRAEEQSESTDE